MFVTPRDLRLIDVAARVVSQLFFWNIVRYSALSELHNADDAAADIDDDDDGIAAAKLAAAGQQTDSRSLPCSSGDDLFFAIKEKAKDYE